MSLSLSVSLLNLVYGNHINIYFSLLSSIVLPCYLVGVLDATIIKF